MRRLFVGSDHAGIDLKNSIKQILKLNYKEEVVDVGAYQKVSCHYPDFAQQMAKQMKNQDRGILVCGSGIGIAMAAAKAGLKASTAYNQYTAKQCAKHVQVMAVGQRVVTLQIMQEMIVQFLGQHTNKIESK